MELSSSRRRLEEFDKRLGLPANFAEAVEFFSAYDDYGLAALFDDALRPIGPYSPEQLAEFRLRFVQLPHSRISHVVRLCGLVNKIKCLY
jgi:hypothetical protein